MTKTGEFIGACAANFVVSGAIAIIEGTKLGATSFGIGLVLTLAWLIFFRKKGESASAQPIHIDNKPIISPNIAPTINVAPTIQISASAAAPVPAVDMEAIHEHARREAMIIEFLKKGPPHTGYDVAELSQAVGLSMPEVRDIMERLKARRIVWSEGQLDCVGGFAYFLDPLHRAQPTPPQPKKPNTVNVYKKTPEN